MVTFIIALGRNELLAKNDISMMSLNVMWHTPPIPWNIDKLYGWCIREKKKICMIEMWTLRFILHCTYFVRSRSIKLRNLSVINFEALLIA